MRDFGEGMWIILQIKRFVTHGPKSRSEMKKFHNLSWITEINELFHDILIYWDVYI